MWMTMRMRKKRRRREDCRLVEHSVSVHTQVMLMEEEEGGQEVSRVNERCLNIFCFSFSFCC